jgi:hypothetical protein
MLAQYAGTLLLVSHDRYLLNAVTTKTLALTGPGSGALFEGNYAAWREASLAPTAPNNGGAGRNIASSKKAANGHKPEPAPSTAALQSPGAGGTSEARAASGATPPMNARELSKARVKARENVLLTESAVNVLETRIAEVEARLAAPSGAVADMVALAAEHTRLQDDLAAALSKWEQAVADSEALGV